MIQFLQDNWQSIGMTIGLIVAWFVGKKDLLKKRVKMSQTEIESREIENVTKNFKVYQDLITDLEERFKGRIDDLELDLQKIKDLNLELRRVISNQEKYIDKLKQKISGYERLDQ